MTRQVAVRSRVPEAEHSLERAPRDAGAEATEGRKRQLVLDGVLQHGARIGRTHPMRVDPAPEWSCHLAIGERARRIEALVPRHPAQADGPRSDPEHDLVAVANAPRLLDANRLPRRQQAFERARSRVPREEFLGRYGHRTPRHEVRPLDAQSQVSLVSCVFSRSACWRTSRRSLLDFRSRFLIWKPMRWLPWRRCRFRDRKSQ